MSVASVALLLALAAGPGAATARSVHPPPTHTPGLTPSPAEVTGALFDEAMALPAGTPLALQARGTLLPLLGPEHFCATCPDPDATVRSGHRGLDAIDLRVAQRVFDIPLVVNDEVRALIDYFTEGPGRPHFERTLQRAGRVIPFLRQRLTRAGVPRDLVYLSMIESGFSPHATSASKAVGLWQFMRSTGREYDLRIDTWVDERRDPERSTDAAARYLAWLHQEFDDWHLAFAAYNGGPGRVGRALARLGVSDYWTLCHRRALPAETCRYVPKILAAALLTRYPEAFGLPRPKPEPGTFDFDVVEVHRPLALRAIADALGVPVEALEKANPALRRLVTPPIGKHDPPYRLKLPRGLAARFEAVRSSIPTADLRRAAFAHTVARGETLWSIARHYGVRTSAIVRENHLDDPSRLRPGQVLRIPGAPRQGRAHTRRARGQAHPAFHVVAAGETLWSIARRYGLTTAQLCQLNHLSCGDRVVLSVGQRLRLRSARRREKARTPRTHRLAPGETLWSISRRYGVTVAEIMAWNGIDDPTALEVGRVLRVAP